ncbi:NAD-dependent deacylase [Pseudomonas sp. CBSPBW29]|uniref:SIR2 family NAD-dependent protein deacylase n=1 Tax=Pseudomonas TaxID=286 RepID=UPI0021ABB41D|nr:MULTISPECIES: Sir2 family NAD-dependent protein deacetylase [unclassified Pseudomonas]WEL45633.1 NAD-dependent deacylase [Pseudomonas sp. CBSPBW29]WEL66748.1 NAD-dependent deacylase [Pseudomonas sp. CBSPGW29]WEL70234.1 NAD-dependent deacylase [Pseudomonas sp. CBSPCGW29]WEL77187.1 NAD-dependent deacylase [Pseudomonas sp. CBSPAW29]WEL84206.1 NAD-dependent deacylase [Pseudomonas sp. CBSPCAW29]WEL87042.1 NAD-dependent deacylase [Pseudomonas sp. CBSPCBW29]
MAAEFDRQKIVIFTGSGISAESGLDTFNDETGLWMDHRVEDVATPEAWHRNTEEVLTFYNQLRKKVYAAQPNAAHLAIAALESRFDVVVITQNVDDLHERAGSTCVLHLHGQINLAQSTVDEQLMYKIDGGPILLGDLCEKGSQLRPHVVWYGENVPNLEIAQQHFKNAEKVLVVGTSLTTQPAAGLVTKARHSAEKVLIGLAVVRKPYGYEFIRGKASSLVPYVAGCWLKGQKAR